MASVQRQIDVPNKFDTLVRKLSEKLGSSGINSDDVDPEELQDLMKGYKSNEEEWGKYYYQDSNTCYTRNLVDKGNGKSNLLILVWSPGRTSSIHDHADAHCIMKILRGSLIETRYSNPVTEQPAPLEQTTRNTFNENEVTYMSDELGLHKISNPNPEHFAVSLHLYTPPNVVKLGCYSFAEETGMKKHNPGLELYSQYGTKL